MFRKAKRLSQRLGLNKERCTGRDKKKDELNDTKLNEKHSRRISPFVMTANTASAVSDVEDDDSLSTKSTESADLKPMLSTTRPSMPKCQTAPIFNASDDAIQRRLNMMDTNNLELLLSMETQARMDAQAEREAEKQQQQQQNVLTPPRPTCIKFELPVTPPRSRSPARLAYPRARPVRSLPEEGLTANAARHPINKTRRAGWRNLFSDRDEDEPISIPITIGTRVRLLKRPLPTFGYVRFIGGVHFGKGEWVGVELDHGVGNCDGSINGESYFETDPNRGIFVKRHDLEAAVD